MVEVLVIYGISVSLVGIPHLVRNIESSSFVIG